MRVPWKTASVLAVIAVLVYAAWRMEERREVAALREIGYQAFGRRREP